MLQGGLHPEVNTSSQFMHDWMDTHQDWLSANKEINHSNFYHNSSSTVYCIIIHPCDPTVAISYLIRPCDIVACITYLVSHSSSLSYNTVIKKIFQVGCIINTKLPSCVNIICRTSLGFPSWCPEKHSSYGLVLPWHQL